MIKFTKLVASGNDFFLVDNRNGNLASVDWPDLAQKACPGKGEKGADGLLVLEGSKKADVKMRIFNPDGGEVEMCGNGSRCTALYCGKPRLKIETAAGILEAEVSSGGRIKVRMTEPKDLKAGFSLSLNGKDYKAHYVNTGVPHVVHFTEDIEGLDVKKTGALIRYHDSFKPAGTNADFVKLLSGNSIAVRTYERGVEDETLACGTGACASAIIASLLKGIGSPVSVKTQSGEVLKVYFDKDGDNFKDVYLEGTARIVCEGGIDV